MARYTRRNLLAGIGTVGVAAAGTGIGTTAAYYGDEEDAEGEYSAGRVDVKVAFRSLYEPGNRFELQPNDPLRASLRPVAGEEWMFEQFAAPQLLAAADSRFSASRTAWLTSVTTMDACRDTVEGFIDGAVGLLVSLQDVKPGDRGLLTISITTCGNPSYVSSSMLATDEFGALPRRPENGVFEPEEQAGDDPALLGDDDGEWPDFVHLRVSADPGLTGDFDAANVVYEGSFTGFFEALELDPMLLAPVSVATTDSDCSAPNVANVYQLRWTLPGSNDDLSTFASQVDTQVGDSFGIDYVDVDSDGFDFGDELRARGYANPDVNVTQTDSFVFGMVYSAEQCRHNTV
ncbi:hypothetical protein [Haloarchaeobius sp. DT45]|uniref:hypothetical protein n=1 Tax=Haloarchaeobius sp. DT45 TaxID=3446116 RepID=UPI003F6C0E52